MFDAVHGIKFGYVLCGILIAWQVGISIGNYVCTLVHRLSTDKPVLDKKPYCGSCGTLLQVRDLFPVWSALLLRHRCRYCHKPFPVLYTWVELSVGTLFVLAFLEYGFGQEFVLIACLGGFIILLTAIEANSGRVLDKILLCIVVFGMVFRTLMDHSIFGFVEGAFFSLLIGVVLWRKQIRPVDHLYSLPLPAKLLMVGGLCVGISALPLFFVLFAVFYGADRLLRKISRAAKPPYITIAFGLATVSLVLYPKLAAFL